MPFSINAIMAALVVGTAILLVRYVRKPFSPSFDKESECADPNASCWLYLTSSFLKQKYAIGIAVLYTVALIVIVIVRSAGFEALTVPPLFCVATAMLLSAWGSRIMDTNYRKEFFLLTTLRVEQEGNKALLENMLPKMIAEKILDGEVSCKQCRIC
jgi:hypothetical protein